MNTNTLNTINMDEQDIIDMNIYFPTVHKLLFIEKVTELEWLFRVEYKFRCQELENLLFLLRILTWRKDILIF